jgi:serine/threonine protein kinase
MLQQRYRRLEVQGADNHQLGVGAYGVVYKALDTKENRLVAQKKIKLEGEDEGIPATALREISNLKMLKHPNVVRLLDAIREPGKLYLIFELMDSDLKKYMESCAEPLPIDIVRVTYCFC